MGGGLDAALDDIRDDEDDFLAWRCQSLQRRQADGGTEAVQSSLVEAAPVLGQTGRIGDGFPGNKYIGIIRQLGAHQAVPVLKFQLHETPSFCRSAR